MTGKLSAEQKESLKRLRDWAQYRTSTIANSDLDFYAEHRASLTLLLTQCQSYLRLAEEMDINGYSEYTPNLRNDVSDILEEKK